MKKSFRIAIEQFVVSALVGVGVRATAEAVTAHKDGTATVQGVGAKHQARIATIPGIEVISTGPASMKVLVAEAAEYIETHSPNFTPAEKAAMEAAKAARAANRVSNVPLLDLDEDFDEEDDN